MWGAALNAFWWGMASGHVADEFNIGRMENKFVHEGDTMWQLIKDFVMRGCHIIDGGFSSYLTCGDCMYTRMCDQILEPL